MLDLSFVFWGYGSEDALKPMKAWLLDKGFSCVSLPNDEMSAEQELALLRERRFVFLTSAHYMRDREILRHYYPEIKIGLSPLEIIAFADPLLSVFYPHELVSPLALVEPQLLHAFDLVLWPTPWFGCSPRPNQFFEVGWGAPASDVLTSPCWFFSELSYHKNQMGLEATFKKTWPILSSGVSIKFPLWPGSDEFEAYFCDHGATVVPAKDDTSALLRASSVVVSNGLSGITYEAVLSGRPVVNLIEEHVSLSYQRSFLVGTSGCRMVHYHEAVEAIADPPEPIAPKIRPFDFSGALAAIEAALERKRAVC